jgi:branched-chain amino acid transport system substrate-binding protein
MSLAIMYRLAGIAFLSFLVCADAAETVKIALNFPLSGPFANVGDLFLKHAQLAVEEINSSGGVLSGQPIELVPFDNKNSPQEALLALQRATDMGIPFMVQGGGSHIAVPLSVAVARHNARNPDTRMLYLNHSGDLDLSNEKCSFWTFLFDSNAEMNMQVLTTQLARQSRIQRVYLINQDYVFGRQVRMLAKQMLKRKRPDVQIVGDDLHPFGKVKDFAPYVSKIRASAADAVITGNWGNDLALLVKAAGESGLNAEFYTFYGGGPGNASAMGASAIGRVKALYRWHPNIANNGAEEFANEYKKRFRLDYYGLPTRTMMGMLAKAIDRATSADPLAVARVLEGMRYGSDTGEVWMRPDDHQLAQALYVFSLVRIDGAEVKYDRENTGIGTRTDVRVEPMETLLPPNCHMQHF